MSEDEYIRASQELYVTSEDKQHMNEATLKAHEKTKLRNLVDNTMNKKMHHIFKDGHEKAVTGTYTELY